jgi:hypothetical protein
LLHPYRKEYPEDFLAYFQRRFLKKIGNPKSHHVVAVEVKDGQESITGYAEWVRRHAGDDNQMLSEAPAAGNKLPGFNMYAATVSLTTRRRVHKPRL